MIFFLRAINNIFVIEIINKIIKLIAKYIK